MAMEYSSSTPDKNDENTLKIVKDNAKRSHSKTLVKKAKLSLFKKSCIAKSLIPNIDLDETGQFQEKQASDFRIHVNKPVRKPQKSVPSKQEVVDQREGTLNVVKERIEGEITSDGSEQTCPTCRESIPSSHLPSHILLCLKQQFTLVRTGSQDNIEKSSDYQLCQICQKDISHMNSTRRSQHVNHCMDQKEAGLKEEENKNRLLTDAKTAILDCPVCGKSLKTAQSRKSHMKKCSVKMSVTTEKLLALIKNQEEERNVEIAAGVIPNSLRLLRLKSVSSASNEEKKSKRVAQRKNQLDEETQLALALSTSIAEQQRIQDQAIIGQKLTNPTKKTRNRKKCAEDIPLILKLNKEEAKKRIVDRVTQLLLPKTPQNSQENIEVTPPGSSKLDLTDMSVECEIFRSNLLQPRLWTESGLSDKDENGIDKFYVSALMPSVSIATVKAGSKLRRMSAIPGRRNSEELENEILLKQQRSIEHQQSVDQKKNKVNITLKSEQPFSSSPVVTQTAVLLAELAAEADGSGSHLENSTIQQQYDNLHHSGFCPEEPIEIHQDILASCVVSLQQSLLDMVDSPTDSDVTIVTSNRPIPAHKIFLLSRCPQMLQKVTEGNQIDLSSTPSDVVLAVLKYVYAGSILLNPGSLEDVLQLSSSLGLDELENICQTVIKSRQEHPETKDTEEEGKGLDVLENLWSSSSDSDSEDEEVKGHSEGGEVKGQDDCEEDDWREMFYTQREQIKRQNSHDLLNNDEESDILSDTSENLEMVSTEENVEPKDGTCDDKTPCGRVSPNHDLQNFGESDEVSNSNSIKEDNPSVVTELDKDSDSDTRDKEVIEYKSNLLDLKAVSGSMDCKLASTIPKTDDTCSDSEDNCSILDIVDKKRRSNSNSQSSFNDYHQGECNSNLLPRDVTEGISNDFSNQMSQDRCQDLNFLNNSVKTSCPMAASTVTDLSANLFESDDELFSEGEQNVPQEDNYFTLKLEGCPSNSQTLSEANSIDNPICLTSGSGSEVDDEDVYSIGRELQKLENEIVKSCVEENNSIEKDIHDTSASPKLSPNGGENKTEKICSQNVEPKKHKFKFVSAKDKIGKNIQGFAPPVVLISDTDAKDEMTDMSDSEKLCSKRKIDCIESPVSKIISKTPLIQNKRYKVSTPNNESNSIVGHDSLHITPIQNQSRRTFMLETPTSSNHALKKKPQEMFEAIPIKMIDEFSPKRSKKKKKARKDESELLQPSCENDNLTNLPDTEAKPDSSHGDSDIEIVDDNLHEENQCVGQSPKFGGTQVKKSTSYALSDSDENEKDRNEEENENEEIGMDDVWDGFEDVGCDDDIYAAEIQSPNKFTINQTSMEKGDADQEREVNLDDNNDISIPQDDLQGAMNDFEDEEIMQAAEVQTNFKTPTLSESAKKRRAKKPWVAPSPFTPMPNYDTMNTPQLQKQINKYGLRPACKKRMKDVLSTIYHETHQYETDSDCEIDTEKLKKQKAEKIQQEMEMKSKKTTKGSKKAPAKQAKTVKKPASKKITKPPIQTINFPLEGSSDDQFSSSQSSDVSDLPEESILAVGDDDDEDVESEGPKCSKSELHKKLTEYIKSTADIHIDTLQYVPLEIDIFKKRMTENGIKCSMEKLQEYFDEKCISFTMKNNRKPRKQKRKPKQRRTKLTVDV